MRIHLFFDTVDRPWGGSNSFIKALQGFLEAEGHELAREPEDSPELIVLNGAYQAPGRFTSLGEVRSLKRWGRVSRLRRWTLGQAAVLPKLLLRLDGLRLRYAGVASDMDRLQLELLKLADQVVFQSEFSLACFQEAGYKGTAHQVIHNGVDLNVFRCEGRQSWDGRRPLRILASSWSENLAKGQATVAAFSRLSGVEVTFVGRWPRGLGAERVRLLPPMTQGELARQCSGADVFLFPARFEACPNAVLEALACGLPVWYEEKGGTRELAQHYGLPLSNEPARDLERMKEAYPALCERALRDRSRFSIERAGRRYVQVFRELVGEHALAR